MVNGDLPEDRDGVFAPTLLAGERILWQGKPRRATAVAQGLPVTCFGVFFLGFALFWTTMAIVMTWTVPEGQGNTLAVFKYFFPLFGLPFIAIGAGLTFGPIVAARRSWARTLYAVTNQRILVRGGTGAVTVTTTELDRITGMSVSGGADIGDLIFQVGRGDNDPVFKAIERPQDVQRLVEDARRRLERDKGSPPDAR